MKNQYLNRLTGGVASVLLLSAMVNQATAWNGGYRTGEREQAMSLNANLQAGEQIFKTCSHCHENSSQGMVPGISRRHIPGYFPRLAGQHPNVLIKQLADIRSGNRDNPSMYPFTLDRYLNGAQGIADVTGYIASLPVEGEHNVGPGHDLERGKILYSENCEKCHGKNGEGSNEDFFPRLQGQHYSYMLRQMLWIRDGKRRNANAKMVEQIKRFSYRDMKAVADYASRLPRNTDLSKTSDNGKQLESHR